MHYVIGDIHNEAKKLNNILEQIQVTNDDEVIFWGIFLIEEETKLIH